jgi:tight adherence protein B
VPGCGSGPGRGSLLRRRATRRGPPGATQWAALLDALAAELRTGSSLATAVGQALGRTGIAGAAVRPGVALAALSRIPVGDADEAVVVQALVAAHTLGGATAPTFDAAAALLRERIAIRAEAEVHSAQARLSARVLTAIPLVFCAWNVLTSASFRRAWGSEVGLTCAVLGAACNLCGWLWMRRLVAGAQR